MLKTLPQTTKSIPFWRQFRLNLIVFFVVLALLPLSVVSFINISQQGQQAQSQVEEQLRSITELKANQLDQWLSQGTLALNIILSNNTVRQLIATYATAPESLSPEQIDTLNSDITAFADSNRYFEEFTVYDLEGSILLASNRGDLGKVVTLQPYFTSSLNRREYLQAPFYDLGSAELTMIVTHQVFDDAGQLVAILAGKINLNTLGSIMTERTGLTTTGETYLVSHYKCEKRSFSGLPAKKF